MYGEDRIGSLAVLAREALDENWAASGLFLDFPGGCCGYASLLLGALYKDSGVDDFHYQSGRSEVIQWASHGWLTNNNLVVDITADQFDLAMPRIFISDRSPFHESFELDGFDNSDFRDWKFPNLLDLTKFYYKFLFPLHL